MLKGLKSSLMFIGALLVDGVGHFGIKFYHIGPHVATSVECGCRFHFQPTGIKITLNQALAPELQQSVDPEIARYVAEDICILTVDIAFYDAVVSHQQLGLRGYISVEGTVDTDVTVAADITLDNRSGAYDGGAAGGGFRRFGFCSEHMTILF